MLTKQFTNPMIFLDSVGYVVDKESLIVYKVLSDNNSWDTTTGVHISTLNDDQIMAMEYADAQIVRLLLERI